MGDLVLYQILELFHFNLDDDLIHIWIAASLFFDKTGGSIVILDRGEVLGHLGGVSSLLDCSLISGYGAVLDSAHVGSSSHIVFSTKVELRNGNRHRRYFPSLISLDRAGLFGFI